MEGTHLQPWQTSSTTAFWRLTSIHHLHQINDGVKRCEADIALFIFSEFHQLREQLCLGVVHPEGRTQRKSTTSSCRFDVCSVQFMVWCLPCCPGDALQLTAHAGSHLKLHVLTQRTSHRQQLCLHPGSQKTVQSNITRRDITPGPYERTVPTTALWEHDTLK